MLASSRAACSTSSEAADGDPSIREGLNSLAGLFAPPSGAELAGYATANAKRQEAEQLAWLFNNSGDPTASARAALTGRQNYSQTPSGFGKTDATNRRGQDVEANTKLEQSRMQQAGETARTLLAPVAQNATRFIPPDISKMYSLPETQTGVVAAAPGERNFLPDGRVLDGQAKPMSRPADC